VSVTAGEAVIELQGARLGYGRRVILERVDLTVPAGDFLAVIGPNGSGKTTLLRCVLGILRPLAGTCVVRGTLGYAPQRSVLDPVFPLTCRQVVAMGLLATPGRGKGADGKARVAEALARCGMGEHAERPFRSLSGGQKQRVLVARALVADPQVLVLDEPTNDLDLRGEHEIMELLSELHAGGRTVIFVSHLLHVVTHYARRLCFVRDGGIQVDTAERMLSPDRMTALYGLPIDVTRVHGHVVVAPQHERPTPSDSGEILERTP
jgi:zinc/manganese transport system ATP-binding protein